MGRLCATLVVLILVGCSQEGMGVLRLAPDTRPDLPVLNASRELARIPDVEAALEAYGQGKPDVASGLVNRALQSWPFEADLHYLNGQIYAAWSGLGYPQYRELAETAFELTLDLDASKSAAAGALAEMFLKRGAYHEAMVVLARAANLDPSDRETLKLLAMAAYFDQRFSIATWAADRALALGTGGTVDGTREEGDFLAVAALAVAASGDPARGRALLARSVAVQPRDPAELHSLTRGLSDWQTVRAAAAAAVQSGTIPAATSGDDENGSDADEPSDSALSGRWDSCDPVPEDLRDDDSDDDSDDSGDFTVLSAASAIKSAQFTDPLPALPSPCADGPLPRMAMIDVVIIGATQNSSRKFGVNLLDQLEVVFTGSIDRTVVRGGDEAGTVTTLIGNLALPEAGILYSLNVANAIEQRNEVIARPTLVALDRRSSSFSSGESLFVGVSGSEDGEVVQIPAGVILFVTPTFVDNDTVLLAVSASTSSFRAVGEIFDVESTSFDNQVAVANNIVQANVMMDMGQTLILSGIVEREVFRSGNKVPWLGELPGPGFAFNERRKFEGENSVLILLTPRLAYSDPRAEDADLVASDEAAAFEARLEANARAAGLDPSFDAALSASLDPATKAILFQPRILRGVGRPEPKSGDV
jgi:tetratricopeptide (TPR) repeat protein